MVKLGGVEPPCQGLSSLSRNPHQPHIPQGQRFHSCQERRWPSYNVNFVTTPWDFALLFGQTRPENPENIHLELRVTVTLSPQMAKAVALTLMQNVHNYEQQFGEIRNTPLPQKPEEPST